MGLRIPKVDIKEKECGIWVTEGKENFLTGYLSPRPTEQNKGQEFG